jgi:hypothetical protein
MKTALPAAPPAMARTWAWVSDVDGTGVGVEVGEEVTLAARFAVLDEENVVVLSLLLCEFDVELAAALKLVVVAAAEADSAGKSWPSGHPVPSPWQGSVKQHP